MDEKLEHGAMMPLLHVNGADVHHSNLTLPPLGGIVLQP